MAQMQCRDATGCCNSKQPASRAFFCCFHGKSATVKHNNRLNATLLQHLDLLHTVHHMPAHRVAQRYFDR